MEDVEKYIIHIFQQGTILLLLYFQREQKTPQEYKYNKQYKQHNN